MTLLLNFGVKEREQHLDWGVFESCTIIKTITSMLILTHLVSKSRVKEKGLFNDCDGWYQISAIGVKKEGKAKKNNPYQKKKTLVFLNCGLRGKLL